MKNGFTLIRTFLRKNLVSNQGGFTLIELIIAVGLAALLLPAIITVFSFSLSSASQGENFTQAYALAQQEMEAVYFLKSQGTSTWDWEKTPTNTNPGEYYQPQESGDSWVLGGITSTPIQDVGDIFTKVVEIQEVRRYPVSEVVTADPVAPIDNLTRKIIVDVSWKENGQDQKVTLESYVTQH
jgi:prepilin-type N-terminal cleavage/methylation domain-containing protein